MDNLLGVQLSQYAMSGIDQSFNGTGNAEELANLQKALTAGSITGRDNENLGATGGSVLKVESLESQLKVLTFNESEIVLWKRIPKLPAFSNVEEYNVQTGRGRVGSSFIREGELPQEATSTYARKSQLVKYMGQTRSVSHPMQLVNIISGAGNAVQLQVEDATLSILRDVNYELTQGDSNLVPEEFNGLYAQHRDAFASIDAYYASDVVVDLRGKALKDADVQAGSLAIIQNHGQAKLFMGPPAVLSDYVNRFAGMKLIQPNTAQTTAGIMGQAVNAIVTQFGQIELGYDIFMGKMGPKTVLDAGESLSAPGAPIADPTAPVAIVTTETGKWADSLGDHAYAVSAVNRFGESGLTVLGTASVTAANQTVNLKFTPGASIVAPNSFNIYRSLKDQATGTVNYYKIFSVSVNELTVGYNSAPAGLVKDKNYILPNTDNAFLVDPTLQVFSFKQLAPLMKMDLAVTGPATRFMVLLYGTPILYAPKKFVKFINIGSDLS
jgi:hypothetical protein